MIAGPWRVQKNETDGTPKCASPLRWYQYPLAYQIRWAMRSRHPAAVGAAAVRGHLEGKAKLLSGTLPPIASTFSNDELNNSFPLDRGRRFRCEGGQRLVDEVLADIRVGEVRDRRRRASVEAQERASVETLLANLSAAALNVIDPWRFAAVGFNRNDYTRGDLSLPAMQRARDQLLSAGLAEGQRGFQRPDQFGDGRFGRTTRLRATDRLRQRFSEYGLGRGSLTRPPSQLIRLRKPQDADPMQPPEEVEASRAILAMVNERLASVNLGLAGGEQRLLASWEATTREDDQEEKDQRLRYSGDLSAASLYRSFSGNWSSGGRIYGGWWMSVSRRLRPAITIDGARVVELDYSALHPRILFNRTGLPLDFDPYVVPGYPEDEMRALGKRTFARLLNRRQTRSSRRLKIKAGKGDLASLPPGVSFAAYSEVLCRNLEPILPFMGRGIGVELQYQDSLLALSILERMEEAGVPVLPVHDSFIVPEQHENLLRDAMVSCYKGLFGFLPSISRKIAHSRPGGGDPQRDHN